MVSFWEEKDEVQTIERRKQNRERMASLWEDEGNVQAFERRQRNRGWMASVRHGESESERWSRNDTLNEAARWRRRFFKAMIWPQMPVLTSERCTVNAFIAVHCILLMKESKVQHHLIQNSLPVASTGSLRVLHHLEFPLFYVIFYQDLVRYRDSFVRSWGYRTRYYLWHPWL